MTLSSYTPVKMSQTAKGVTKLSHLAKTFSWSIPATNIVYCSGCAYEAWYVLGNMFGEDADEEEDEDDDYFSDDDDGQFEIVSADRPLDEYDHQEKDLFNFVRNLMFVLFMVSGLIFLLDSLF